MYFLLCGGDWWPPSFCKIPTLTTVSSFVTPQEISKTQDDRQKCVLRTLCAPSQLHYFFLEACHLCSETYSKNWWEMLVYLLKHWRRTFQNNYPRSSPKFHLHHFHIDCESRQQVGQINLEHRMLVQMPKHWSFQDAKQILDHLFSVLVTLVVECVVEWTFKQKLQSFKSFKIFNNSSNSFLNWTHSPKISNPY